jgi:exopolyphosphatase/guanosine-5'-triphosphate,3'-diphosphate pyrophosphatase
MNTIDKKNKNIYAAIDLGTNACRLTIAFESRGRVKIVDTLSRIINFGEGLYSNGVLSEKAMARGLRALNDCARKISQYTISHHAYVATEACRRAENVTEFLTSVKKETGLDIKTISSSEEAYFSTMACLELMDSSYPYGIVFDIGGGSTEISWFKYDGDNLQMLDSESIPFGFITISDPDDEVIKSSKRLQIRSMIQEFYDRNEIHQYIARDSVQMIGVSGTMNSLVNILLNMGTYTSQIVNGFLMRVKDINEMLEYVSLTEKINGISSSSVSSNQRYKFLSDSCIILSEIHNVFYMPIVVADRGLRDGVLLHMIRAKKSV